MKRAARSGSVWELEDYALFGRRHAAEVRQTLLPKAALAEAVRKGSVTDLREVAKKYPGVADDARLWSHALFDKTLCAFEQQAASDPRLVPFMEKLLAYLEKSESSKVAVRFYAPSAASLEVAEKLLSGKA